MQIVKHNAITSTNALLKEMLAVKSLPEWTVFTAEHQSEGRGQITTDWVSDRSKNLLISVYLEFDDLLVSDSFYLICAVSLAVYNTLSDFSIPEPQIKWPNDIMAEGGKIAGILIENTFVGDRIKNTIVGIGLNVNQDVFPEFLPHAVSMKMLLGENQDREAVLHRLLKNMQQTIADLKRKDYHELKSAYERNLFQKGRVSDYETLNGNRFKGKIIGVAKDGKLVLETADSDLKLFSFKEIKFR